MTDWYAMVDGIQAAMQAVDKAHDAAENLREMKNKEAIQKFQAEMAELCKHLEQMKQILAHEDTYTMDELADALSKMLGEGKTYHRIEHYDVSQR